jgi:HSP20 family protein
VNLIPWNPFREMDNLGRELGGLFSMSPFQFFGGMTGPRMDLYQTDTEVVVKAELPGVSKEDLNVYIDDNTVRLAGQTKRGKEFKDENVFRSERYYGSFSRTIPLSEMVSLALHSMVIIAVRDPQLITVKDISAETGFSGTHLAKVLQRLVKAGLINSHRGPKGGFNLAKPAEDITFLDIYELIEGHLSSEGCPMNRFECPFESCIFGDIPQKCSREFREYMKKRRLSDFVNKNRISKNNQSNH